ncbi:transposase [Streptomyces sp. NPDC127197]|uniref:transposase n=1 Tax=Streptomyces sp. NPDC127197 TaxID=3345388 RepID=UPI00363C0B1F
MGQPSRNSPSPGIGPTAAAVIVAEIGLVMNRFPTPGHLASWAKFAPGGEGVGREESTVGGS